MMKITEILKSKKKRFLSIDFGQVFIKIIYIESSGSGFTLLNYDFKKIPSAQDNRTEIINFIRNFIEKNSIPEKKHIYLTLSEPDSIIIKYLVLPQVPKGEIPEAIKWQLKQESPLNLENTVFDWQIIKESVDEEGAKKNGIMCILAKRELIDRYLAIVGDCNLMPVRISNSYFNYANILRYHQGSPFITAILDVGHKNTTLCIYNNNRLNFIRSLAFSSEKLTQSLTGTLAAGEGKIELSPEKAEEIKNTFGIPEDETAILQDNIQAIQIMSLMRSLLEGLAKELKRSFDYFSSSFKEERLSVLYLSGGGANLKNLDRYLNKELNINVSRLPLPDCINVQAIDKEKLNAGQNLIMSAVGAALADSGSINLLPQEIRTQKVEFIEKVSLRFVAIVLGAIFLFSLFIVKFQIYDYKKRLKNTQIHLRAIEVIRVLKQRIDLRENLINKIQKDRVPVDGLLKLIAAKVPNNIILDELDLDQKEHVVILKGVVSGSEIIAGSVLTNFIGKLEASSFFAEATLTFSRKRDVVQEFQIKCDLAH